jgi:hypothetical protein
MDFSRPAPFYRNSPVLIVRRDNQSRMLQKIRLNEEPRCVVC